MSVTDSELLTPAESRLNDLEAIITTGKRSFIEVGNALSEILANELYKPKYKTFAKYVEARWGFSRQYAHCMIQGCEVKKSVPDEVSSMLDNPRKCAAAAKVPTKNRSKTVLAAQAKADAEGRKMRAQDITDAATVDAESTVIEDTPETPTDIAPAPAKTQSGEHVWTIEKFETAIETIRSEFMDEYADREDFLRIGSGFMRAQVAKLEKRITHLRRKKQTQQEGQI